MFMPAAYAVRDTASPSFTAAMVIRAGLLDKGWGGRVVAASF